MTRYIWNSKLRFCASSRLRASGREELERLAVLSQLVSLS